MKATSDSAVGALSNDSAKKDLISAVTEPSKFLVNALSVPRREGVVEVDGCDIHYFAWGDPSKPPIIMMHGFLAHARCFAFIAPYLAQDYHVVAMDLSGMGDSGWRPSYSEPKRVEELMTVARHNQLFDSQTKPMIIAHSYGGRIGTAAMAAHADQFKGLIICDLMIIRPSILRANADKFSPSFKRDPNRANRIYPDLDAARARFVLSPPQPVEQPELFDYMAYHSLRQVDGGWQWKFDPRLFDVSGQPKNGWESIGEDFVAAPGRKAIIYGAKSMLFTDDSVNYIGELVSKQKAQPIPIVAIPYARHHLMLDQPVAFITALKSMLSMW
ncbi:MAG: alpha/beta hydrolase [Pseudomonadota bacterium]